MKASRCSKPIAYAPHEPAMNAGWGWAPDVMRDRLGSARSFRTLNLIDEADRGASRIDVAADVPGRPRHADCGRPDLGGSDRITRAAEPVAP